MKNRLIAAFLLGTATLTLGPVACKMAGDEATAPAAGTALGIDPAMMDKTVKPGDDFYAYAAGTWMKNTAIPPERSSISSSYVSQLATEANLKTAFDELLASTPQAGTDAARIKDYYTAFMDTKAIDAAGMAPAKADLDRISAIGTVSDLSRELGAEVRADVDPFNATNYFTENLFGIFVTQAVSGGEVVPYFLQGGLGLPEREYYLSADPAMTALRTQYRAYIEKFLTDAGLPDAAARAQRVYDLETRIAQAHMSREESEDYAKRTTEWHKADFATKAPGIDWTAFLAAAQLGAQDKFAIYHERAVPRLAALVASQPLDAWKDWLTFHRLNATAEVLPAKLRDDHFAFYGTALSGTTAPLPRDKRILTADSKAPAAPRIALGDVLGDAVGKLYTDRFFPASTKTEIQTMVDAIKAAFVRRVEASSTLADATKQEAIAKVQGMEVGIGYPDTWKDYAGFTVDPHNAYADARNGQLANYRIALAKLGKPLDRREWWMNSFLVNAVNLPLQNALNFPAAILQKPDFDPANDPAANYGATGATIGHEVSHSFDNGGAAFDAAGRMRNWWTPADFAHFTTAGGALARQFDTYEPFPGTPINGELTLGENIADVVGLQAAYDAYHASLGGKPAPVIDGYTGDQRFFIAFAQSWATKMRDELMRQRLATDGHAPGMYRALTVRNIDAWYDAFGVKPGDKLYLAPDQRVRIW